MNGFVLDSINNARNETNPVAMFDKTNAPIINKLAMEFAVFDHWHCSVPGAPLLTTAAVPTFTHVSLLHFN